MYANRQQPSILPTLGLLIVGMIACLAWAWSSAPDTIGPMLQELQGTDYILFAVFLILGVMAAALFSTLAQAVLQLLMIGMQIGLLVVVAWAGVILWRHYADGQPVVHETSPPVFVPAAAPQRSMDPDRRRKQLEQELYRLDAQSGQNWWESSSVPNPPAP